MGTREWTQVLVGVAIVIASVWVIVHELRARRRRRDDDKP